MGGNVIMQCMTIVRQAHRQTQMNVTASIFKHEKIRSGFKIKFIIGTDIVKINHLTSNTIPSFLPLSEAALEVLTCVCFYGVWCKTQCLVLSATWWTGRLINTLVCPRPPCSLELAPRIFCYSPKPKWQWKVSILNWIRRWNSKDRATKDTQERGLLELFQKVARIMG